LKSTSISAEAIELPRDGVQRFDHHLTFVDAPRGSPPFPSEPQRQDKVTLVPTEPCFADAKRRRLVRRSGSLANCFHATLNSALLLRSAQRYQDVVGLCQ
jgi:hypothetical protein